MKPPGATLEPSPPAKPSALKRIMPTKVLFGRELSVEEIDPTPEEIAEACANLRRTWPERKRRKRLAHQSGPVTIPDARDLRDRRKVL